jgi:uncharacterized protein (TIGR03000 family)
MYSIVMVAAMAAAPEAPNWCCKSYSSCSGCCGGCTGVYYSCGGCCGGYSCCGGYGCHGVVTVYSGCCGGSCYGGWALSGCGGGYMVPATSPGYVVPPAPVIIGSGASEVPAPVAAVPATRGQVIVKTPADAKLYADGQATTLSGTERVFQTPELATGKDYQYTLKIEYAEGKETKTASKQVIVRAGSQTIADFTKTDLEKVTSPVTVTLPEKSKLFVDGSATQARGGTHSFRTPELTKGKPYVYQFRAEVEKDGRTEVLSREVTFNAGEPIVVDFTSVATTRTALK